LFFLKKRKILIFGTGGINLCDFIGEEEWEEISIFEALKTNHALKKLDISL